MNEDFKLSRYNVKNINSFNVSGTVIYNGTDNLFPNYLDGLYLKSVTHQTVINDLVNYILGYGLQSPSEEEQRIIKKFFNKRALNKLLRYKLIHNAYVLEIIKNELGRIVEINVLNPSQIRVSQIKDGKPVKFEWRRSWDNGTYFNNRSERVELDALHVGCKHGIIYKYDNGIMDVPYGRPSYLAGLDPIELEISIYMMHNHGAQNGMFPSMLIAKESSGDPEKDREDSELTAQSMAGVANAGKVGTTYYPQGGSAPVFSTPNLSGIDKVYENQYNTAEAGILKAHGIPSPSLIAGLNVRPSGFASPADELEWAKTELETKIIKPLREEFFEDFESLFIEIGLTPDNLTFDEVKEEEVRPDDIAEPTEMSDKSIEVGLSYNDYPASASNNAKRALAWAEKNGWGSCGEATGKNRANQLAKGENISRDTIARMASFKRHQQHKDVPYSEGCGGLMWDAWGGTSGIEWASRKLKEIDSQKLAKNDFDDDQMLDALSGEKIDLDEWELVDVREANGENVEDWANSLIVEKKDNLTKLVDFITSKPNGFSYLDKSFYKVRYTYQEKYSSGNSRQFCKSMMGRTANGVVYRLEDIDKATRDGVNQSFGHKGAAYDLFKYKGGVQCGHYWQEELYRMKDKTENLISRGKEVSNIPNSYTPRPRGNKESKIAPKDMPNAGAYPQ